MSNVSYDLDTSGGLMPLIRALIKPPDEDLNVQKPKKPQHPYYKRPGKGHNHDSCDACGEGGDLICCDRCPASFHLGCYDPPLDENDIPAGQWLCRECRAADAEKSPSARGSRAQSPADNKSDTEKKTRSLRNSRVNSAKKKSKEEEEEEKKQPEKELTAMEVLVKAARIMNPRQFELPREMTVPCPFPGTEKEGGGSSLVTVDAWGLVPVPAKLCFVCQDTCKAAPLLQCDYCPLLFHQDCLDPPLTALPTGRWMCPNHVEQYIDWKLVNSVSATERVALWDRFAGPVDQHAIKIDFIRRARNAKPNFRVKVPVGVKGRVVIPAMVRHHYRHPPPLLPSRREYVRCTRVMNTRRGESQSCETLEPSEPSSPKHRVCLNLACPEYRGGGPCALAAAGEPTDADPKMERHSDSSSDLSDSDFEYFTASVKRRKVSPSHRSPKRTAKAERLQLRHDADVQELLEAVDEQLHKLDERLIRLLAWQRLQQVSFGSQWHGVWSRCPVSRRVAGAVRRAVAGARLAERGAQLPSDLLSAADRRRIAQTVWGAPQSLQTPQTPQRRPAEPESPQHPQRFEPRDATVRATLTATSPTNNGDIVGAPIPMRRACVTVGSDSGCDVRLDTACARVSPHHATIFMDEVTRHFELINYSEWGSVVNGVLYACDVSAASDPPAERPGALRALRGLRPARGSRGSRGSGGRERLRINGSLTLPLGAEESCRCLRRERAAGATGAGATGATGAGATGAGATGAGATGATGAGATGAGAVGAWEGSALVPHGALLAFGCQAYVFSITDYLAFPYDTYEREPAL